MRVLPAIVIALAALPASAAFDVPAHPVDVILGRPTATSVTVSVVAYQDGDGLVEVGPDAGGAVTASPTRPFAREQAVEFVLAGLQPDTAYRYRLLWRAGTSGE